MSSTARSTSRRTFLSHAAIAGSAAITVPLDALRARLRDGARPDAPIYGPLTPVADGTTGLPVLHLPEGFRYLSFGWTGDPLEGGGVTPPAHDGMAAFAGPAGAVHLMRNHELSLRPGVTVFDQGRRLGGAMFARLEGAWHAGGRIYLTSTSGGDARMEQVWELTPASDELCLVYESPGQRLRPRGGVADAVGHPHGRRVAHAGAVALQPARLHAGSARCPCWPTRRPTASP